MSLTRVQLKDFTAFSDFSLDLSPGINVFVGRNGVGKTHLMKVCYAACEAARAGVGFSEQLVRVFRPRHRHIGRLIRRQPGCATGFAEVHRSDRRLRIEFAANARDANIARTDGAEAWQDDGIQATFIPVEEVIADAPGPPASDEFGDLHTDLLGRALRPLPPGSDSGRERILNHLQPILNGRVTNENHRFYLVSHGGNLEFSLVADGERRLGLLWRLLRNGTLRPGCTLFWDSPETGLNPLVFGAVMETILELHRVGAQVFLATHSYVILKELALRQENGDTIAFHSLFRAKGKSGVQCNTVSRYSLIHPNSIAEAFDDLYDRTIVRSIGTPAE